MPANRSGTQVIGRAVAVMRAVALARAENATLPQVMAETGLSRSTAFRILRALTEARLLSSADVGPGYRIGPLTYELGLARSRPLPRRDEWLAVVRRVAKETRLTSYLIARSGEEAVCLLCVQGNMSIRAMPIEVGQRVPLGDGAGSLAILSSLADEEVDHVVGQRRSKDERRSLLVKIARTRRDGFATSSGTVAAGVSGVGVVVPPGRAQDTLAVTVSAVVDTMPASDARAFAACITRAIGGLPGGSRASSQTPASP